MTMTATPEGQLDFSAPLHDPTRDRPGGEHSLARDTERRSAREKDSPHTTAQRLRVLEAIANAPDGLTDYECGQLLGIVRTSAGKRRLEAQRDGWVADSGQRRSTDTGSTAVVWILTDAGREAWQS